MTAGGTLASVLTNDIHILYIVSGRIVRPVVVYPRRTGLSLNYHVNINAALFKKKAVYLYCLYSYFFYFLSLSLFDFLSL